MSFNFLGTLQLSLVLSVTTGNKKKNGGQQKKPESCREPWRLTLLECRFGTDMRCKGTGIRADLKCEGAGIGIDLLCENTEVVAALKVQELGLIWR